MLIFYTMQTFMKLSDLRVGIISLELRFFWGIEYFSTGVEILFRGIFCGWGFEIFSR